MKKIYIYTILCLGLFLTSCTDDSLADVNDNPNVATDIEPEFLFGYATLAWSGSRTGGDCFLPITFANQSLSTGGNSGWGYGEDRYDISPFSVGNTWRFYFVNGGNNLNLAIEKAESAIPVNNNAAAQCKIVLANTMLEATMIYGDIPFREAWNSEIANPVFDSQEQVLNDLLLLLDEAVNQIDEDSPLKIDSNDAYFSGDLVKWKKYANSLKLKILMIMVDKSPDKAELLGALVSDESILIGDSSDNVEMPFFDEVNAENPKFKLFRAYSAEVNEWIFANDNVFNFMSERNDPRISKYFDANASGNFVSVETATEANTELESPDASSPVSLVNIWAVDAPDLIYSYQELLLLKAEIYARGLGVATDLDTAQGFFQEGVMQSLLYYGVDAEVADNYVTNSLVDISLLSPTDAVYEIHVQQWVDLMDRAIESWVQSRRSGPEGNEVPNLEIPLGAPAGGLFRRFEYPVDELNANSNAPSSISKIFDNLWFDN